MPDQALVRLIYVSRNLISGPHDEVPSPVEQSLETSRANNAAARIAGALMFRDGCFAQILEGPADDVFATFDRISADPRHGAVVMICENSIDERQFGEWDMAFVGQSTEASERFAAVVNTDGVVPALETGDWIIDLVVDHLYRAEQANTVSSTS